MATKGESKRGEAPLKNTLPPKIPLDKGKGDKKRVPRKIEDFSGCLKGDGVNKTKGGEVDKQPVLDTIRETCLICIRLSKGRNGEVRNEQYRKVYCIWKPGG